MSPDTLLWDKNLTYLTGLNDRSAYLLLAPEGVRVGQQLARLRF
jgi:hypothetical protein